MDEKLIITKKTYKKGEDGHKTFSIRIRDELAEQLDALAAQTGRSRNDLVNTLLNFALARCKIEEEK